MKFWRKVHKWLGLIIALQVLFWISGGVVMSVIPIDMVRGKHLVEHPVVKPEPSRIPRMQNVDLSEYLSVAWVIRSGDIVLKTEDPQGNVAFLSHQDLSPLPPLTPEQIKDIAGQAYLGEGKIGDVRLLENIPQEAKRLTAPVYRVDFNDWIHTSFYLAPDSGRIVVVRSDLWRLFDFFWMLHIMDYEAREDFNNGLLISAAVVSLFFTFSGMCLLYFSIIKPKFRQRRYRAARS